MTLVKILNIAYCVFQHLETVCSGKEFSVTLADGSSTSQEFTMTTPIKTTLGDFGEKRSFTVFALSKYDAILGKPWLTQTNLVVDFRTNVMERHRFASQPPIPETGPSQDLPPVELNFISEKQARHELRKGEQGFLAWVSGADSKNNLTAEELGERIDSRSDLDDQQVSSWQHYWRSLMTWFPRNFLPDFHQGET